MKIKYLVSLFWIMGAWADQTVTGHGTATGGCPPPFEVGDPIERVKKLARLDAEDRCQSEVKNLDWYEPSFGFCNLFTNSRRISISGKFQCLEEN